MCAWSVKDINLIHWRECQFFPHQHYPYAEEMYQLCDREGIVVIDETPAVGIGVGDKIDPYKTFYIREHHEQVLREMIARDKNHPCVVMWSMGNEPDTEHFPESAYDYWHSLYELTHSIDPARPSGNLRVLPEQLRERSRDEDDGRGVREPLLWLVQSVRRS